MSKSLLAGLKQIAQTHPETRHHLVPLIRQAAITRQDLAFFDKPGLYKPVQVQRLTLGGSYTYSGYLRDEEIQEGEQAEEEGPKSVLQLIAAGIQLEDRPGWGAAADATRKAEDFLKRRRVQLLADLRLQAESYAEKTFAELAVRYPMADTKQLPGPTWLWGIFRDI